LMVAQVADKVATVVVSNQVASVVSKAVVKALLKAGKPRVVVSLAASKVANVKRQRKASTNSLRSNHNSKNRSFLIKTSTTIFRSSPDKYLNVNLFTDLYK